jgi:hypothetical protein
VGEHGTRRTVCPVTRMYLRIVCSESSMASHLHDHTPPLHVACTLRPINFIPQQFDALRKVPLYSDLIKERFERCLDLYLCPRAKQTRVPSMTGCMRHSFGCFHCSIVTWWCCIDSCADACACFALTSLSSAWTSSVLCGTLSSSTSIPTRCSPSCPNRPT